MDSIFLQFQMSHQNKQIQICVVWFVLLSDWELKIFTSKKKAADYLTVNPSTFYLQTDIMYWKMLKPQTILQTTDVVNDY